MKAKIVGVIGVLGYIAFSVIEFWKLCAVGEYMSAGFALCGMGILGVGGAIVIDSIAEWGRR